MAKSQQVEDLLCSIMPLRAIPGVCAYCGSGATKPSDFRDTLSRKEYTITRMCQGCQDALDAVEWPEDERD
jgi:hypothetical protein